MQFSYTKFLRKSTIALLYLITYRIVVDFTNSVMNITQGGNTPASLFFPAQAVTLAFLLYFGIWLIPFIPINILILTIEHNRPLYTIILLPLLDTIVYGGAAYVLIKKIKINTDFKNLKDAIYFLLITALGAIIVGSGLELANIYFNGAKFPDFLQYVTDWFLGDIAGIYSLTPLLMLIIFPFMRKIIFNRLYVEESLTKLLYYNFLIMSFIVTYYFTQYILLVIIPIMIFFIINKIYYEKSKQEVREFILIASLITIFTIIIFLQPLFDPAHIFFLFFIPLTAIALIYGLKGSIVANNLIILEVLIVLKFVINNDLREFQMVIFSLSCVALIIGVVISERQNYLSEVEALVRERTVQLENTNRELEFFSYSVSHDLRVPLTTIDNIINAVLLEYEEQINPEINDLIIRLKKNTNQMQILIDDLLKFFKLSQQKINKELIEMNQIIDQAYNSLSDKIKERNLELEIESNLPTCLGDPILLSVVWTNLLSNAIKYSSKLDDPKISIGTLKGKKGTNVYFIKDNGVGFDMKDSQKLFNVFQRLHPEYEGTGIGLALVKNIIDSHNGKIWAEGKKGEGATFYFII